MLKSNYHYLAVWNKRNYFRIRFGLVNSLYMFLRLKILVVLEKFLVLKCVLFGILEIFIHNRFKTAIMCFKKTGLDVYIKKSMLYK